MSTSLQTTALAIGKPSIVRIYLAEAASELLRLARTPSFAAPTLAFPLVFYVMFGIVLPGSWGGLDRATYLLATYGVFGVIGPSLFGFGVGMAMERQQGWLELKRVSPMPIAAYFFAKIAMSLVFALAVVCLLTIVCALLFSLISTTSRSASRTPSARHSTPAWSLRHSRSEARSCRRRPTAIGSVPAATAVR